MTKAQRSLVILCSVVGGLLSVARGEPLPRSPAELAAVCDGKSVKGKVRACVTAGRAYFDGDGVTADHARASALWQRACDAGDAEGCGLAGSMLETGDGGVTDGPRAVELYTKGCKLNDARSCCNLGSQWAEGKNVPRQDLAEAKRLYEKSCALNLGTGCFNLGNSYRLGESVPVSLLEAKKYFERACELKAAGGCTELAILYYEGKGGVPKDVSQTKSLLQKACTLGSNVACKNLDKLNAPR